MTAILRACELRNRVWPDRKQSMAYAQYNSAPAIVSCR